MRVHPGQARVGGIRVNDEEWRCRLNDNSERAKSNTSDGEFKQSDSSLRVAFGPSLTVEFYSKRVLHPLKLLYLVAKNGRLSIHYSRMTQIAAEPHILDAFRFVYVSCQ
jgi:hypothetical protein